MKKLIAVPLLFMIACSFSAVSAELTLLDTTKTFTPDGRVFEEYDLLRESGTINGQPYKFIYKNGNGDVGSWYVGCEKDPITDRKSCTMVQKDLRIDILAASKKIVSIGQDHFPGSVATIRIDEGMPITSSAHNGEFSSQASTKIVEQLKHAKSIKTRYMKWPYRAWIDGNFDQTGFNEAYKYINWALNRIN